MLAFLFVGCTKFEVTEILPEIDNIDATTIDSRLDRINIKVDKDQWKFMYVNYQDEIEITALVHYFGSNGDSLFSKNAKLQIKGASSTHYPMRSIGIVFENEIDNTMFKIIDPAQALPGDNLTKLRSVRLRNSGNDNGVTQLKDLALTELAASNAIDLELKYGKPVQVFVNDAYFGLLNLRTENDVIGLADLLNVSESDITILKMDYPNGDIDFREGDETLAQQLIDAIKSEDGDLIEVLIDIPNFIDYILYQDYIGNMDWPHNNVKLYSVNGSKFRFLLYDLDYAATTNRTQRLPKMEYLEDDLSKIYQIIRANDESFISALESRQEELYDLLSTDKFNTVVDDLAASIDSEMGYQIKRWGAPYSLFQWHLNLDQLKQDFRVNEFYNRKVYGFL